MKKKLLAVLSLVMVLAMESVTVFAAPSPTSSTVVTTPSASVEESDTTSSGDVGETTSATTTTSTTTSTTTTASATQSGLYLYGAVGDATSVRILSTGDSVSETTNANITIDQTSGATLSVLTESVRAAVRTKAQELKALATAKGFDTIDIIAVDVNSASTSLTLNFYDSRVIASDKDNDLVEVYHMLPSGVWETPAFTSFDGGVTVTFENGFSPVLIVKYSNASDSYATAGATVSGDLTSPKTADAYPYATVIALAALVGVVFCTKKMAKR